ncbi:S8 family serine peptidase [Plantactinospora sp. WMMB782]|uniref:S8 family serine peptidase n=1 Tax=Plantactinospora sp. WMMB782 TaxID=3404121 RepID=UPI003B9322A0
MQDGPPPPADEPSPPPPPAGTAQPWQAGSPQPWQAGSPQPQQAGSPQPQQAGSPQPQQAGSPQPQQAGSPQPQQAGSPQPQQAGSPQPRPVRPAGAGVWPVVAAVLVGVGTVGVTVGSQAVAWLVEQVLLVSGLDGQVWLWPTTGVVNALLVGIPAGLLAALPRSPAVRAAGRAWLLGALALGALGLLRVVPPRLPEVYLAGLAVAAGLGAQLIRRFGRRPEQVRAEPAAVGLAVAGGLVLLLPWVWLGALGGVLETVCGLLASAAVGRLAATILDGRFWAGFERVVPGGLPAPERSARGAGPVAVGGARLVLVGGLVAGVALALVAGGIGQSGAQLAALLVLPPAGFALAALRVTSRPRPTTPDDGVPESGFRPVGSAPVGWLVGVAAAGPLLLVDPEEITLLLAAARDVPFWAAGAAAGSLAVALLLGIGYGVGLGRRSAPVPRRPVAAAVAGVLLLATGAVYAGLGSPGWHGERLFVVLREQADLTGVPAQTGPAGRQARGREVYRRLVETAERSQAGLRRDLDRLHLDHTPYYLVNAIEVDGGTAVRAWLSRRDDVDRVLVSQRLRPLPAAGSPRRGDEAAPAVPVWNLGLVGADRVWSQLGVDGSGVVVGGSDSGVDGRHPALAGGFRGGDDSWYDPWNDAPAPTDLGGHGTHTLATAVGDERVGVAPGAQWVGCVNLDRNLGNPARYLDCLQFMLAPFPPGADPFTAGRPDRAPQVLSNSWGCPAIEGCAVDTLRPATSALASAGIFFVAAAGNTGSFCGSVDDPPAPYPDVLTVGAVDRQRRVTSFSSRGPTPDGRSKPDLVAPGEDVLSALPGGGYGSLSGTSMAAPHLAGVVALMWSANPALIGDLATTRRILLETAGPAEPTYLSRSSADTCGSERNITGEGLVDAYAAVQAAQELGRTGG